MTTDLNHFAVLLNENQRKPNPSSHFIVSYWNVTLSVGNRFSRQLKKT